MGEERKEIPFGRPARIGNFRIWRSRLKVKGGKEKEKGKAASYDIEQINISTLDGTWQVKIPATFEMFAMITELFAEHDGSAGDRRTAQLSTVFGNMMYASVIANGYFQQALNFCTLVYSNPSLLDEKDGNHKAFIHDVKIFAKAFTDWAKKYREHAAANGPTREETENEQAAEEILAETEEQQDKQ